MTHYPAEFKKGAVDLYRSRPQATIKELAADLGVNPEALHSWIRAEGATRPRGWRSALAGAVLRQW